MCRFRDAIVLCAVFSSALYSAPAISPAPVTQSLAAAGLVEMIFRYEYFPHYYQETLSDSDQYSSIEALIDDSSRNNASRIILTERATGKPVYFAGNPAVVETLVRAGYRAYTVPVDIRNPEQTIQRAVAGFALRDDKGQAVRWRFIYAYSSSVMGSGLTPLPAAPVLTFQYRTEGSVAAEGSAVEVANKVSYAQLWKELSVPPYFVAYRGYYGQGFHEARLASGDQNWKIAAPLGNGSNWDLLDSAGRHQSFTVTQSGKDGVVISTLLSETQTTLESAIESAPDGPRLRSIKATHQGHIMPISYRSPVPLSGGAAKPVEFQIDLDKNKKVAHGTVEPLKSADGWHLVWRFNAPEWAKSRIVDQVATISSTEAALRVIQK